MIILPIRTTFELNDNDNDLTKTIKKAFDKINNKGDTDNEDEILSEMDHQETPVTKSSSSNENQSL